MGRALYWMLALGATAALGVACSESTDEGEGSPFSPDEELIEYFDETFGLRLYDWTDNGGGLTENAEGYLVSSADGLVEIDGFGAREMAIEQLIEPVAMGNELLLQVRDEETGAQRYFLYDFDENYVVFGEDTGVGESRGAGVQSNPDGTYEVWTFDDAVSDRSEVEVVADGYAAMRRVDEINGFSALPPHLVMTAFALGHTSAPEARSAGQVVRYEAAIPPACSVFKTFCDCVACRVLDRGGECDLCPEL